MMNLATQTSVIGTYRDQPKTDTHGVNKWPVWLRILVIVSLSSALWTQLEPAASVAASTPQSTCNIADVLRAE